MYVCIIVKIRKKLNKNYMFLKFYVKLSQMTIKSAIHANEKPVKDASFNFVTIAFMLSMVTGRAIRQNDFA